MVIIRLARGGSKGRPFFRIVVADSRFARDGRFIERIGYFNPVAADDSQKFRITDDRLAHWRATGAQLSPTVKRLIKQFAGQSTEAAPEETPATETPPAAPEQDSAEQAATA